ncbi:MAG: TIGR01458 family HAD-type hydrolase [Methyloversatilis sp.]|uniref:TIGR01458 family HAD-type hydrolase n=1 Tax=Methyloversatilis sp. TaxID=2569862 RepID=UPI0025F94C17|nr:TIGR01458 family HAD-type hydrolase [Methyloversatilis sp.]MCR6666115.1 TIGR01458 family HAD-type hydrolase [Methyloversatilis sp.]
MSLPANPKALLVDLAGVLHVGDQLIPGSIEALARLRAAGFKLVFLTNTTRTPRRTLVAKMQALGLDVRDQELLTAPGATMNLVRSRGLHPHWIVHPDLRDEVGPDAAEPDAVVLGDAGHCFDYAQLNTAFRLIMRGLPFIAMARNRHFKEEDGLSLDMGAFVAGLEYSTGVKAEIAGKPAAPFFQAALDTVGVHAGEAIMIGDDLRDDIGGAQAAGIAGVLVRTGKYSAADEHNPDIRPAAIEDDFARFAARLL